MRGSKFEGQKIRRNSNNRNHITQYKNYNHNHKNHN